MKTKNLMTAFALSTVFAACTQDTELNETLAKNDFSNIPMVEAEFTVNTGVDSRMATKFGWEVGDKVGLAWMGDGTYVGTDAALSGAAYQNHPLFCTDATKKAFKTETMLYVGKYFAYMPYTQGNMDVEFIKFDISKQPLTANANDLAKQAIYLSTENVTLKKANEDGEVPTGTQKAGMGNNIKLNLALLNNAATIKFAFKNIDALTDLKITGVTIDMLDASQSGGSVMPIQLTHNGTIEDWTDWTGKYMFDNYGPATTGAVTLNGELAVSGNALTTYALLLPSKFAVSTLAKLNIILNTNYGTVVAENVKVDNAKLFTNFGETATVTAEVDGKDIKNTVATAKTQAELNDILTKLAASAQEDAVEITLNPETAATPNKEPFVLTDFTLPESLKAQVTLIAGDKTNETIEFAGNTVVDKKLVLGNAKSIVTGTMTVNYIKNEPWTLANTVSGAVLEVSNGATLINNGIIAGSLGIKTLAATTGDNAKPFGKYISNSKEASMGTLENLGEAQWIAGTVPSTTGNQVYAEATNLAGIEAADANNVRVIRLIDGAVVENLGELSIQFSEIWSVECYGEVTINITATPRNAATVFGFPAADMIVKENANVAVNSNKKENNFVLGAKIDVEKNSNLYIQNVSSTFKIINAGSVTLLNAGSIVKGTQATGSSWQSTTQN